MKSVQALDSAGVTWPRGRRSLYAKLPASGGISLASETQRSTPRKQKNSVGYEDNPERSALSILNRKRRLPEKKHPPGERPGSLLESRNEAPDSFWGVVMRPGFAFAVPASRVNAFRPGSTQGETGDETLLPGGSWLECPRLKARTTEAKNIPPRAAIGLTFFTGSGSRSGRRPGRRPSRPGRWRGFLLF
jgi:hypothetical protein